MHFAKFHLNFKKRVPIYEVYSQNGDDLREQEEGVISVKLKED